MKWTKKLTAALLAMGLCVSFSVPSAAGEPLLDYELQSPSLDGRLTYSDDGRTATLFAPYVTKEAGWYDANKNWQNDAQLCWAASCSNVIAWYLDVCEQTRYWDVSGEERNVDRIFDRFRSHWYDLEGQDPVHGMNWYFTGGFFTGEPPSGYEGTASDGGYLRYLPHAEDTWYMVDPARSATLFGDTEQSYPMLDDIINRFYPGDPLYDHANFSETIRHQLTYGAAVIGVAAENASSTSSHAITLWGCDYDVETGLISRIYVTDSDDEDRLPGHRLKEIRVKAKNPDREGIRMEGYYLMGSASPITEFLNSMLFFAPNVIVPPAQVPISLEDQLGGARLTSHSAEVQRLYLARSAYDTAGRQLTCSMELMELRPGESIFLSRSEQPAASWSWSALSMEYEPLCPVLRQTA